MFKSLVGAKILCVGIWVLKAGWVLTFCGGHLYARAAMPIDCTHGQQLLLMLV